jgi:hypothetical protein
MNSVRNFANFVEPTLTPNYKHSARPNESFVTFTPSDLLMVTDHCAT